MAAPFLGEFIGGPVLGYLFQVNIPRFVHPTPVLGLWI